MSPALPTLLLRTLRALPLPRGKERLARKLLSPRVTDRCTLIRDAGGNALVVPNLNEPVGLSLGLHGCYEPELMHLLRVNLGKDSTFLDIGANIGVFTVGLAGVAGRVIAVEASSAVLSFLRRNVELNTCANVEIFACAASAPGTGQVPFYIPPMDHFGMGSSAPQFHVEPVMLAARTVDQILGASGAGRVGAIKVDVEGFEAHVFLGAAEVLRSANPPLVAFEFCDWAEQRAFPGRKGWAQQLLREAGYEVWLLPDYLRKRAPLGEPVTTGCHTIIGYKATP